MGKLTEVIPSAPLYRSFSNGDKVLLFLPIPSNPLKSKFSGPYVVSHKLSDHNYVVYTPDRRRDTQLVHINLMKLYHERNPKEDSASCIPVCNAPVSANLDLLEEHSNEPESEVTDIPSPLTNPKYSHILANLDNNLSYLTDSQKNCIQKILLEFPEVTSDSLRFMLLILFLVPSQYANRLIGLTPSKKEIVKEVDFLLEHDLAEPSCFPWASPSILVPKPDGSSRFCTDFRRLNCVTIPDSYPLPLIDDLVDNVGQSQFITTIDLQKGYYQIGLTEEAKPLSAFITPFGLFQYRVLPFGLINAPATFQRVINYTIQDLPGIYAYLDDLVIISDDWDEHQQRLRSLLARLRDVGLTINLSKSTFASSTVTYLGHVVGRGQARPKHANIEAILSLPTPGSRKSLMRFLGMAGFYRKFCPNFSIIASPLTDLTSSKVPFVWSPQCESSFQKLKLLLSSNPVLKTPDIHSQFIIQTDASQCGVGAVLLQTFENVLHPVSFHSYKLKKAEKNYSTIEKETLALVIALRKFRCYLYQHVFPIIVYSDHNPLVFLQRMKNNNQRILRWALQVQEYVLDLRHIRGVDNIIADTLSRNPSETSLET